MLAVVALIGAVPVLGKFGGSEVEIDVKYSKFSVSEMKVERGTSVTFVINNEDPIDHEFIVGDDKVHSRHESGTEKVHGGVPGEVSVPAMSVASTTFTFTEPGVFRFVCHLPGHRRYGMEGVVTVTG